MCLKYIQLVNEACETKEAFNILNVVVVDLKKRFCDANNCQANAEENNISLSCRKFETFGILCQHALKIIDV